MLVNINIEDQLKRNLRMRAINSSICSKDSIISVIEDTLGEYKIAWYLANFDLAERMSIDTRRVIWIAGHFSGKKFEIGGYSVSFIRQKNSILPKDIYLLQFLDLVCYSKRMQYEEINKRLPVYRKVLMEMESEVARKLVRLSRSYQPFVRVVLACLWKSVGSTKLYMKLVETVNPKVLNKYTGMLTLA